MNRKRPVGIAALALFFSFGGISRRSNRRRAAASLVGNLVLAPFCIASSGAGTSEGKMSLFGDLFGTSGVAYPTAHGAYRNNATQPTRRAAGSGCDPRPGDSVDSDADAGRSGVGTADADDVTKRRTASCSRGRSFLAHAAVLAVGAQQERSSPGSAEPPAEAQ